MELIGVEEAWKQTLEPVPDDLLDKAASLAELHKNGYTAFSLGAVYVYAYMEQSLPERFAAENIGGRKHAVRGGTACFDRPILARCEKWNFCLDVMDNESYKQFKAWMLIQMYVHRPGRNVFIPRIYSAPVMDPFALRAGKRLGISMDVYSVSGMYSILRPVCEAPSHEAAPAFIDFERRPPEQDAHKNGLALLATMGIK